MNSNRNNPLHLALLGAVLAAAVNAAPDAWTDLTAEDGLAGDEIQFLTARPDGSIWVGTETGLCRWSKDRIEVLLPQGRIWDVCEQPQGRCWVGTANGVILLGGDKPEATLAGHTVSPVIDVGGGLIWAIATARADVTNVLMQHLQDAWSPVPAFKDRRVEDMTLAGDGTVWVTIEADGVMAVPPDGRDQAGVHHLEGQNVTTVFEDRHHRIWCGTWGQGLFVLTDGHWQQHLADEDASIIAIVEDAGGQLWVGTSANGLWRQTGDAWTNDLRAEGGINMLAATSDGRVWISTQTQGGLRYWDGESWQVSLDSPLPVRCLLEMPDALWAGGVIDGLHRLMK